MIPNNCQCPDCLKVWEKFEEQNPCDVCGSEERTPDGYLACECPAKKFETICPECKGKGYKEEYYDAGDPFGAGTSPFSEWVKSSCPRCSGIGKVEEE